MSTYEDILYDVKDHIAVITLNRPDKLNAWTAPMQASVKRAVIDAANDDNVRVIVVTGAGRGFCAGADMGNLQQIRPEKWNERELARTDNEVEPPKSNLGPDVGDLYGGRFGYLMSIRKPVIAAINGPCAGLGLCFALFCDMRFASRDASFTTAFARRGLIAEHGMSWTLPRLIGHAAASDLLLSGRKFMAPEALELGMVNRLYPADELMSATLAYAKELSELSSPRSLGVIKRQLWATQMQSLDEAMDLADHEMALSLASDDFKEGVRHFVEKRAPAFTGR